VRARFSAPVQTGPGFVFHIQVLFPEAAEMRFLISVTGYTRLDKIAFNGLWAARLADED